MHITLEMFFFAVFALETCYQLFEGSQMMSSIKIASMQMWTITKRDSQRVKMGGILWTRWILNSITAQQSVNKDKPFEIHCNLQ